MSKLLSLIFILVCCQSHSQFKTLTVLDELSREPVPYATVRYGATGSYTGGDGTVKLADSITAVEVSHLSYKTKHFDKLTDILLLTPNVTQLKEVVLQQKRKRKSIKFSNGSHAARGTWNYFPDTEHLVFVVPEPKVAGTQLDEVRFFGELTNELSVDSLVFAFSIYDKDKKLLCKDVEVIETTTFRKEGITARPSQNILLMGDGLYFGIEFIGWYDKNANFFNYDFFTYPGFYLRTNFIKGKNWDTYFHNLFKGEDEWLHLNGNNKQLEFFEEKPQNLRIELKLLK
jgi:hypothetical protein